MSTEDVSMDPISLLIVLAIVGLAVGLIMQSRKRKMASAVDNQGASHSTNSLEPVSGSHPDGDQDLGVLLTKFDE